jgi:hypothetical protein
LADAPARMSSPRDVRRRYSAAGLIRSNDGSGFSGAARKVHAAVNRPRHSEDCRHNGAVGMGIEAEPPGNERIEKSGRGMSRTLSPVSRTRGGRSRLGTRTPPGGFLLDGGDPERRSLNHQEQSHQPFVARK